MIEKKSAVIDAKIKVYLSESQTKNHIIYAYVLFRSMEGRDRAIQAYKLNCCKRMFAACCYRKKLYIINIINVFIVSKVAGCV